MNLTKALEQLEKNKYFVWDDFLNSDELNSIHQDFIENYSAQKFKRAGIGKGNQLQLNDEIRRDETLWLEPSELNSSQKKLWEKLEFLKQEINQHFFSGLWELEGHYSYYPIGGMYHAHLDRFSQDDSRTISMVLYLNKNWNAENGGELRIHLPDSKYQDISPTGGRLVCFFSADVLHEVLEAKQPRFSFAGWWKRR